MAAVEMKDRKKEMIEKTAQEFQKLNGDNQMFILGYMIKTVDLVRQIIRHNSSVLTKSAYFITYNESHLPK